MYLHIMDPDVVAWYGQFMPLCTAAFPEHVINIVSCICRMPHRGLQQGLRTRSPFEWLRDLQRGKVRTAKICSTLKAGCCRHTYTEPILGFP